MGRRDRENFMRPAVRIRRASTCRNGIDNASAVLRRATFSSASVIQSSRNKTQGKAARSVRPPQWVDIGCLTNRIISATLRTAIDANKLPIDVTYSVYLSSKVKSPI